MASLGYTGNDEQKHRLERAVSVMAIVIIPIAVSVHTVVSWVFSMTVQPMWHSAIFGPYFVVGAIFSGIATLLIAMAVLRKLLGLENYLTNKTFNNLALLLLGMSLLWLYFTFAEHLTVFYGAEPDEMKVLNAKLTGEFDWVFWGMVVTCFVVPFFILAFNRTRNITGIVIASILINIGMWIERYQIVVPTLSRPRLDYLFGSYFPSWVEWSIFAGEIAVFSLLYVLFVKIFPIVSVWEVREGEEKQAHAAQEVAQVASGEAEAS
jgi:molybdopterin-containing oxidoreductase family membrane subunit